MIPTLSTARLTLNAFNTADCARVEALAGSEAVARGTLNIPHPYPQGASQTWIAGHQSAFLRGDGVVFAIRLGAELIGCISLGIARDDARGELGYWLGESHWNHGYATEAAHACVQFGFDKLGLRKISARHFASNPASGRVMEKIRMTKLGLLKNHVQKAGTSHDVVVYELAHEAMHV